MTPGVAGGLIAMLGWGVGDYAGAVGSRRLGPFRMALWGAFVATALIVAWGWVSEVPLALPAAAVLQLAAIQAISTGGTLAYYRALQLGRLALLSPLSTAWVVVSVALAALAFGQIPSPPHMAGILAIVVGVAAAGIDWPATRTRFRLIASDPGGPWLFLCALGWGVAFALLDPFTDRYGWLRTSFWAWILITLLLAGAALFVGGPKAVGLRDRRSLRQIGILGAANLIAAVGYYRGLEQGSTAVVAAISAMHPLVAVALSRLLLRERLSRMQWAGIALALPGVVLVSAT